MNTLVIPGHRASCTPALLQLEHGSAMSRRSAT